MSIIVALLKIFQEHLNEPELERAKKSSGNLAPQDFYSFLVRATQLQHRFQRGFHDELARTLIIYNDLLKQKKQHVDHENAYQELYGMTLERFLQIAYSIWIAYGNGRRRKSEILHLSRNLTAFKQEEFMRVFDKLSTDATKFKELEKGKEAIPHLSIMSLIHSKPFYFLNQRRRDSDTLVL
jgi:inosine-uridine nucleoside N-ribohydrolase